MSETFFDPVDAPMAQEIADVILDAPNTAAGHAFRELLVLILTGEEDPACLSAEFLRRADGIREDILESIKRNQDSDAAMHEDYELEHA